MRALLKYVDDVNIVSSIIRRGSRWEDGALKWNREWEVEDADSGVKDSLRTIRLIQQAANEIVPWLKFTYDSPDLHSNGKVPMLDVQVWIHPGADLDPPRGDVLAWEFYEKPLASCRILRSTTAYGWRPKIVTLNMECFRRHRNSCRQLSVSRRAEILISFVKKMRRSGYSVKTASNVIEEGSRYYYRKLRADLEGGPPLNKSRHMDNLVQSRRAKRGASEAWFKRRRGGGEREGEERSQLER